MKVCLPILGDNALKKELIANNFYKAQHYCIYDLNTKTSSIFTLNHMNSLYLSISEIKEQNIQVIITPNLRPMAAKILFENEIEVYQAKGSEVEENISLYKRNLLKDFSNSMIENKRACSPEACSSCTTSSGCTS